jgi:hypothetical protein
VSDVVTTLDYNEITEEQLQRKSKTRNEIVHKATNFRSYGTPTPAKSRLESGRTPRKVENVAHSAGIGVDHPPCEDEDGEWFA